MPNPKHRFSKTRTAKRRTHYKLEAPTFITLLKLWHFGTLSPGMP